MNIFALTLPTPPGGYPGFISVNRRDEGGISFTVRSHDTKDGAGSEITISEADAAALASELPGK